MENTDLYRVKIGDPFGGYVIIGSNLTLLEADKLVEDSNCDYFTLVFKEKQ